MKTLLWLMLLTALPVSVPAQTPDTTNCPKRQWCGYFHSIPCCPDGFHPEVISVVLTDPEIYEWDCVPDDTEFGIDSTNWGAIIDSGQPPPRVDTTDILIYRDTLYYHGTRFVPLSDCRVDTVIVHDTVYVPAKSSCDRHSDPNAWVYQVVSYQTGDPFSNDDSTCFADTTWTWDGYKLPWGLPNGTFLYKEYHYWTGNSRCIYCGETRKRKE